MTATGFGPATVANLIVGFDVLGLAVAGEVGDRVEATVAGPPGVRVVEVVGDGGRLPRDAARNTAGVAARETLRLAGAGGLGVELRIRKGLPLGSGLGSSAASAVAAAVAVNRLLGDPLDRRALIPACVEAEAAVSGRHADNVAPALLGGLVLVRSLDPLEVLALPLPAGLGLVVVTPEVELETRVARAALPARVALSALVRASAHLGAFVAACHSGDVDALGRCLVDEVVEPARFPLIPGSARVADAARAAGALGAGLSGSGPSMFALVRDLAAGPRVAGAMVGAFTEAGLRSTARVVPAAGAGATVS